MVFFFLNYDLFRVFYHVFCFVVGLDDLVKSLDEQITSEIQHKEKEEYENITNNESKKQDENLADVIFIIILLFFFLLK